MSDTTEAVTAISGAVTGVASGVSKLYIFAIAAAVLVALIGGGLWYAHHTGYASGTADTKAVIAAQQRAIELAAQEAADKAAADYQGAVLARANVEKQNETLTQQVNDLSSQVANANLTIAASASRINGLLGGYADRAKAAQTSAGSSRPGPDWIGVFGECVGTVNRLAGRVKSLSSGLSANASQLKQVGNDAAKWADQVNGLRGYISALPGMPTFDGLTVAK